MNVECRSIPHVWTCAQHGRSRWIQCPHEQQASAAVVDALHNGRIFFSGQRAERRALRAGLEEGTKYHFRIVAENAVGTVEGEDQTFTTLERSAPQSCENLEYHIGFSTFLPDCRAYELVTPAQTLGEPVTVSHGSGGKFFNSWFVQPRGAGAGDYFERGGSKRAETAPAGSRTTANRAPESARGPTRTLPRSRRQAASDFRRSFTVR